MTRGIDRAPRWAWVVMGATAVVLAVLTYLTVTRPPPPGFTAPPGALVADEGGADGGVIVGVYGDSYTGGSGEGGVGSAGWPALLKQRIPGIVVGVSSAGGAGYTAVSGLTGETFTDLVESNPRPGADIFIIFGSRNDGPGAAAVGEAAADVYASLRATAPDAQLLVIGPPWVNSDVPANVRANAEAIRAAAEAAGARFVDPVAEGWFFDRPELIGGDGVHPTDEGHAYMAGLIEPVLREMAAQVPSA